MGHEYPVIDTDYTLARPAGWFHADLDQVREESPFTYNTFNGGFWMVNRFAHVREALTMPDVFSNQQTGVLGNRNARARLLPQNLNGAEHMAYRRILNPWFGPAAVERTEPLARRRCQELLDALVPMGGCDLVNEFAMQYPTEIFLAHLGLPVEDGVKLLPLVAAMFRGFFGGDPAETAQTVRALKAYFQDRFDERLVEPRSIDTDFVTWVMQAEIDGRPLPHDDRLTLAYTIMLAGLDTTRSALGYILEHLATHDDDRHWLIANPDCIPTAVEEFLRLYGLLIQDGRYVERDIDFHGCPMKQGDVVWFGLASANRDPREFERPDKFVRDRLSNRHVAFGAGPHHCLGAHLARKELVIVLEEWLARIPHFWVQAGADLRERGGQLTLLSLPLEWTTGAAV